MRAQENPTKKVENDIDTIGFEKSDIQHLQEFALNNSYYRFAIGKENYGQRMHMVMGNRLAPPLQYSSCISWSCRKAVFGQFACKTYDVHSYR